jgi:hypothetical protein
VLSSPPPAAEWTRSPPDAEIVTLSSAPSRFSVAVVPSNEAELTAAPADGAVTASASTVRRPARSAARLG